jgi:hypothetical protein
MDRAGYDERAAVTPPHVLAAPLDEKRDAPSSMSSDSIRSEERRHGAEAGVNQDEKAHEVTEGDSRDVDAEAVSAEDKLSLQRSKSVTNAASIPDGGLWAWLQVLGAFFLLFNSWYVTHLSFDLSHLGRLVSADFLTHTGALLTPSAPIKPTTKLIFYNLLIPRLYPGSAPYKPSSSSSWAALPALSTTRAISARYSLADLSSSYLVR